MEATTKKTKGKKTTKKTIKHIDLKFNLEANLDDEEPDLPSDKSKIVDEEEFKVVQTVHKKQERDQLSPEVQKIEPISCQQELITSIDQSNNNSVDFSKDSSTIIKSVERQQKNIEEPLPQIYQLKQQHIQAELPITEIQQQIIKDVKVQQPRQQQIIVEEELGIMKFSIQEKPVIKKQEGAKTKQGKKKKDSKKTSKTSNIQQNFDLFEKTQENELENVQTEVSQNIPKTHFAPHGSVNQPAEAENLLNKIGESSQPIRDNNEYAQQLSIYFAKCQEIQKPLRAIDEPSERYSEIQIRQQGHQNSKQIYSQYSNVISAQIEEKGVVNKVQQSDISKVGEPIFQSNLYQASPLQQINYAHLESIQKANIEQEIQPQHSGANTEQERIITENSQLSKLSDMAHNKIPIQPIVVNSQANEEKIDNQKGRQIQESEQPIAIIQLTKVNAPKKGKKSSKSGQYKKIVKPMPESISKDFLFEMTKEQEQPQLKTQQMVQEHKDSQSNQVSIADVLMTNNELLSKKQQIEPIAIISNIAETIEDQKPAPSIKQEQQYFYEKKEEVILPYPQQIQEEAFRPELKEKIEFTEKESDFEIQNIEMSIAKKKTVKKEAKSKKTTIPTLKISQLNQPKQQSSFTEKEQQIQNAKLPLQQNNQKSFVQILHPQCSISQDKGVQLTEQILLQDYPITEIKSIQDTEIMNVQFQNEKLRSISVHPIIQSPEVLEKQKQTVAHLEAIDVTQPQAQYSQISISMNIKEVKKGTKKGQKSKSKKKPVKIEQQIDFIEEQQRQHQLECKIDTPIQLKQKDHKEEEINQNDVFTINQEETHKAELQENPRQKNNQASEIFKLNVQQSLSLDHQIIRVQEQHQIVQKATNVILEEIIPLQLKQQKIQQQPQMELSNSKPAQQKADEQQQSKTWQQSQSLLIYPPQIIKTNIKSSKKGSKKQGQKKKKKQTILHVLKQQNNSDLQIQEQLQQSEKVEDKQPSHINQTSQIEQTVPQITGPDYQKSQLSKQSRPESKSSSRQDKIQIVNAATNIKSAVKNPIVNELINLIRFHNDQQIRHMRERIKMLEEDIRSRMIRTQQIKKQDQIQALSHYREQTQLFNDIVEQNLSLKKQYMTCKNR